MRQPDIHRAKKVLKHLKEAKLILSNIKYENVSGKEYGLKRSLGEHLENATWAAEDLIRVGGGEV